MSFARKYAWPFRWELSQSAFAMLFGLLISLITPFLTQAMVDDGIGMRDMNLIVSVMFAQLFIFFGSFSMGLFGSWVSLYMSTRININILSDYLTKLLNLPIIMTLGLLVILDGFEIRSKTSINLFVLNDSTCKSYMAYSTDYYPQKGDTIEICQTIGGDISFVIKDKRHEPANLVFLLESTDKNINMPDKLSKNSFTSGFIFTDKIKLRELILKKLSF